MIRGFTRYQRLLSARISPRLSHHTIYVTHMRIYDAPPGTPPIADIDDFALRFRALLTSIADFDYYDYRDTHTNTAARDTQGRPAQKLAHAYIAPATAIAATMATTSSFPMAFAPRQCYRAPQPTGAGARAASGLTRRHFSPRRIFSQTSVGALQHEWLFASSPGIMLAKIY